METITNGGRVARPNGLAWIGAGLAGLAAVGVGTLLAVFAAATVVVIGVLALVVIGLGSIAYRVRRGSRPKDDPTILEARNVGGHTWVAYSWDKRGR